MIRRAGLADTAAQPAARTTLALRTAMLTVQAGDSAGAAARKPPPSTDVVPNVPECPVCFDPYSEAASVMPRMLPCGHTACQGPLSRPPIPSRGVVGRGHV
jgi:hypothetical protein